MEYYTVVSFILALSGIMIVCMLGCSNVITFNYCHSAEFMTFRLVMVVERVSVVPTIKFKIFD